MTDVDFRKWGATEDLFGGLLICWCLFSVAESCPTLSDIMDCTTPGTPALCPSLFLRVCSDSCPLSQWCYPNILCPTTLFFCLQPFPASGCFPMSQLYASSGQSIGTSASASVLPMNIQGWFPLGLTGLISLQSKGLSRVFSSTTIQKHHIFCGQPSLWFNSHIYTWLLDKP